MASSIHANALVPESCARLAARTALLCVGVNVFLVMLKIGAGWASGSLSVLAEGVQSLLDVGASLMIFLAVRTAARPPDASHPWGHGKFENLSALVQTLLVLGSIGGIWWAAWGRWQEPVMPRVDVGALALVLVLAINLGLSSHVRRVQRQTESSALSAEVVHLRGDMWACLGVLLGLGATWWFQEPRLDPLCASLTMLLAGWGALGLGRETLAPLLDESLPRTEELRIARVLEEDPRVLGFHKLRTRRAGSQRYADVHVLLDDDLSFRQAHEISEEIEIAIRAALPRLDVVVHAEPFRAEIEHQQHHHRERQS